MVWAISLIGLFYLFSLVLGFGAAALVGADVINRGPGANSAAPLLAYELGGTLLLGFISAVAFATILAVVGIDDHRQCIVRPRRLPQTSSAARCSADDRGEGRADRGGCVIGWFAIVGGILARTRTSRSWWHWPSRWRHRRTCRRSSTRCSGSGSPLAAPHGASTAAITSVTLIIFSPVVSSRSPRGATKRSMLQGVDFHWFPLDNPGLVPSRWPSSAGWAHHRPEQADFLKYAEMEVRSLTGAGAEKATVATAPAPSRWGVGPATRTELTRPSSRGCNHRTRKGF